DLDHTGVGLPVRWSGGVGRGGGLVRRPREMRRGDPGKTRTSDTQFRKLLLYPPELRGHIYNQQLRCSYPLSQLPLTPRDMVKVFWRTQKTTKGAGVESEKSTVSTG